MQTQGFHSVLNTRPSSAPLLTETNMKISIVLVRHKENSKTNNIFLWKLPDICLHVEFSLLKRMFFKRKACKETNSVHSNWNFSYMSC